jgi:hydroxypyruvate isomerase
MADCRMRRMPRLAANLSTLFRETSFLERFAAARRAGFRAVEYQFPYEFAATEVAAAAADAGVQVVLHNAPRGEPGDVGTACLPGREARFRDDVELAVQYARAVGCESLHILAGVTPPDADPGELRAVYVANLKYAAARLEREGMRLLIEPVSSRTAENYFLTRSAQALGVLDEVAAANAFLQYDVFHMQLMEGNLAATIERLLARIGHVQIADAPGRDEPGSGEINFAFLLAHIDRLGYAGWIGCEYNPRGDTLEGLKWAKPYL